MEITSEYQQKDWTGLCFTNLVDFDMQYGHRRDSLGYAQALDEFDEWLGEFMKAMRSDDVLIITADHGCDPYHGGTDHTREYIFGLIAGEQIKNGTDLGTRKSFADIGATVTDILTDGGMKTSIGESFRSLILK